MESGSNKPMNLTDINDLRTCRDQLRLLLKAASRGGRLQSAGMDVGKVNRSAKPLLAEIERLLTEKGYNV